MHQLLIPQQDPNRESRQGELKDAREVWKYGCWEKLHSFAERAPYREFPRWAWIRLIIPHLVRVFLNKVLYNVAALWQRLLHPGRERRQWRMSRAPSGLGSSRLRGVPRARSSKADGWVIRRVAIEGYRTFDFGMRWMLGEQSDAPNPSAVVDASAASPRHRYDLTVADFKKVYRALPVPPTLSSWTNDVDGLTDEEFAWLRVAGPNPEMLQRVDTIPEEFPDDLAVPGGASAQAAAKRGELFLADYAPLRLLVDSSWHGQPRFVCAARALFAVVNGQLVPVAIQCTAGGEVLRPGDAGWNLAKHVVQVADGNYHELISHLGRTHLLVEIFLMATRRNLAANHPLHRLLVPHFEGTVFINDQARGGLIAPDGPIDQIFAGTIDSSKRVAVASLEQLDMASYDLPTRIRLRGTEKIAEYPWRDDALAVWNACETFVAAYLLHFYPNDGALLGDTELGDWSAALAGAVSEGGVPGFVAPRNHAELTRIVTLIIFTASAQHAAVNFPQYPVMSFSPLVAGAGWAPAPQRNTAAPLIEFLPPLRLALEQANTLYLLSAVHYTQLGHYEKDWFGIPNLEAMAADFRARLAEIERGIVAANKGRRRPYTHLLPSLIPQSINI